MHFWSNQQLTLVPIPQSEKSNRGHCPKSPLADSTPSRVPAIGSASQIHEIFAGRRHIASSTVSEDLDESSVEGFVRMHFRYPLSTTTDGKR